MNLPESQNVITDAVAEKLFTRKSARQAVEDAMAKAVEEGRANILTDEEERLLRSFRRFKATCKAGSAFKWQTRPVEGVVITAENAPLMIHDPQEVA